MKTKEEILEKHSITYGFSHDNPRAITKMSEALLAMQEYAELYHAQFKEPKGEELDKNCPQCESPEIKVTHTFYDCFECGYVWEPEKTSCNHVIGAADESGNCLKCGKKVCVVVNNNRYGK